MRPETAALGGGLEIGPVAGLGYVALSQTVVESTGLRRMLRRDGPGPGLLRKRVILITKS